MDCDGRLMDCDRLVFLVFSVDGHPGSVHMIIPYYHPHYIYDIPIIIYILSSHILSSPLYIIRYPNNYIYILYIYNYILRNSNDSTSPERIGPKGSLHAVSVLRCVGLMARLDLDPEVPKVSQLWPWLLVLPSGYLT